MTATGAGTTNEHDQLQLQMILADNDQAQALRFLKEVIWVQVQAIRRKELRSHLERGQL